jgi:long-chain acyl-CoA synthetase
MKRNTLLTAYEIKPQLTESRAKAIFVSQAYRAVVEGMAADLPDLKTVVPIPKRTAKTHGSSFGEFLRHGKGTGPDVELEEDDVVLILFTGGTTGAPKGVMLTHRNLLTAVEGLRNRLGPLGEMVALCAAPLSHIFGLNTITFASLFRKCSVVLEEWFHPEEAAQLIERYRISNIFGVPTVVRSLIDIADRYDMSCIQLAMVGAAPVPEELYHKVEETFHCLLVEGWGLTEGSGCTTVTPPGVKKIGSCGRPYDGVGVECTVVGEDDHALPAGEIGELVQRGPLNMKGYFGNPEATAETLRNGWLHTGDLARMDEDGYFYIVDRKKDVIIRGGFNIYPAEVEAVLYTFPGVQEAAVFGVADARKGETVAATIKVKEGADIGETEILSYCQERLARYKVPKYISITHEDLPKTPTGKIMRRSLRIQFDNNPPAPERRE